MKRFFLTALIMGLGATQAFCADDLKMPVNLDRLASRATETVDVTLDSSMLQLASKFLSSDDPDNAKVKQIVSKLKSVYVRSFEFSKDAQYSMDDIAPLQAQLKSPQWSRIVRDKSKTETAEVYVGRDGDKVTGLVVIDAEPRQLTVVHINGPIDVNELSELGGHMGIPRLGHAIRKKVEKEQ
ncbi:MAG TPA: DUF4252 domain-containing protein [Bryobacteraceae bacterium]|jgi:hypothetical protein|nr:DUF4252 domain-containing protein [Bryobacteraceae bacterium]